MTYNTRSPAVKRLMKEAQELSEATELYYAKPLEDNLFEWHFTIRGPGETDFEGGFYHGRIILPPEYPMKPPNILLMTPSGRFEINRKICLSISGYHPETWRPSWSIRTALLAIIGFMPTHGIGAIGSLEYPPEERRKLAKISVDFSCPQCGPIKEVLKSVTEASVSICEEAKTLAEQISFTGEKPGSVSSETKSDETTPTCVSPAKSETAQPQKLQQVPVTPQEPSVCSPSLIPLSFEQWKSEKLKQQASLTETKEPVKSTGDVSEKPSESKEDPTPKPVHSKSTEDKESPKNDEPGPETTVNNTVTNVPTVTVPSPASPTASISVDSQSSIVQLQQRQELLFKLILALVSVLIVMLAVRLNNMNNISSNDSPAKTFGGGN